MNYQMNGQREFSTRVYHDDTDIAGVVYHSNYLKFMERARTEWLFELGFDQTKLLNDGILFVVRRAGIDLKKAAHFGQKIKVLSTITEIKKVSLTYQQDVVADTGELFCRGTIQIACITTDFKPCVIPETILKELRND